jgi:hypothetical protein
VKRRQSRGGFLLGVLSSAALVATFVGINSSASASTTTNWKLGYYNTSGRALSMSSVPSGGQLATFNFTNQDNTALLVTDQGANKGGLIGNQSSATGINATFADSALTGAFTYYGEPSCGGSTANVRFFFQTGNAGGFNETHYWWSNPAAVSLSNGAGTTTYTLNSTFGATSGAAWSDFYGHFGNDSAYSAGFNAAVTDVTTIGLSFGGGCFFENGVGTTDGSGTFTLSSFGVS